MIRRPPRSKLTDTLVPYTTPSRSCRFEPSFTVHRVAVGAIELPTSALARRTVALHIAQMRLGALEAVSAPFDGANLDDGAALTNGGEAVTRLQDATDAGPASDAAAGTRRPPGATGCAAARGVGGGEEARTTAGTGTG